MEQEPFSRRFFNSTQRAGESVRRARGRSANDSTSRGRIARPSCTRFHAASNRSSASPAAPMRISSFPGIALEVVAELLHGTEFIVAFILVHHAAPAQAIAQVVVQLDLEDSVRFDHRFPQQQHMAYRTIYGQA